MNLPPVNVGITQNGVLSIRVAIDAAYYNHPPPLTENEQSVVNWATKLQELIGSLPNYWTTPNIKGFASQPYSHSTTQYMTLMWNGRAILTVSTNY